MAVVVVVVVVEVVVVRAMWWWWWWCTDTYSLQPTPLGQCDVELFTRQIIIKTEKTFKNEHRSKDAAAKKRPNTSVVGKN